MMSDTLKRNRGAAPREGLVPLVLLAPWLVIAWRSLAARSSIAEHLGRYSTPLWVFNMASVVFLMLVVFGLWRGWAGLAGCAAAALFGLSFVATANNELAQWPPVVGVVLASRLGLAALVVNLALWARRHEAKRAGPLLALGAGLVSVAGADFVLRILLGGPVLDADKFALRVPVDFQAIGEQDTVVIGDSFVWGEGVGPDEPFAVLLDTQSRARAGSGRVYNLGQNGAGPDEYLAMLRRVEGAGQVVLTLYPNDIPPRPTVALKVRQALLAAGQTSTLCRLLGDLVGAAVHPDVDRYLDAVVGDFDPGERSYAGRWDQLSARLADFAREANRRSRRPPVLVLLPIMVDFRDYPLTDAHARLGRLGDQLGFRVVDFLPSFRLTFVDGRRYRAGENDNHFNAQVHCHIADSLSEVLWSKGREY